MDHDVAGTPRRTARRTGLIIALAFCLVANGLASLAPGVANVALHTVTGAIAVVLVVLLVRARRHAARPGPTPGTAASR